MTLFPLSVLPTSMPRRNARARPLCLWGPRNVSGRGKMSVSTKISCMQTNREKKRRVCERRQRWLVSTDLTWAKQHDEVDSVVNANPQPPWAQLPLPQVDVPLPPPRLPQAKPMVPRRILLHHNTSYSLINPSIQPLVGHI